MYPFANVTDSIVRGNDPPVGPIIGGVLGGLVGVVLLGIVIYYIMSADRPLGLFKSNLPFLAYLNRRKEGELFPPRGISWVVMRNSTSIVMECCITRPSLCKNGLATTCIRH